MRQLEVDRIEAGRMNLDQDFARTRDRIGNFRQPDMVRYRAIATENECAHRFSCNIEGFK